MIIYEIRIQGHVGLDWDEWFEALTFELLPSGETVITGPFVDQAALRAMLNRIWDMNLTLLALNRKLL